MENKNLLDLAVKYGLDNSQVAKLSAIAYQIGISDFNSREFKRVSSYICEMKLIDKPPEELIEELKLKGLIVQAP